MKFLIAPNALKGSLSALNAAAIISRSILETDSRQINVSCPVADGGDGTLDCLIHAMGGKTISAEVHGPVSSLRVHARWGVLADGRTAVIEIAEAAGLRLLKPEEYDVAHGSTFGVGELIREALNTGCAKILIGLGGSATNDGGAGCAKALGVRFLDDAGQSLPEGGINLSMLRSIDMSRSDRRAKESELVCLSDVTSVLYGPEGAAQTFAQQKGGTKNEVALLDEAMKNYAAVIRKGLHRDVADIPGSGAAGGLGAGLSAFFDAKIESGIDFILDTVHFDDLLDQCDCVITAEGMVDSQTLKGKGIEGITRRARKHDKPVHAFVGRIRGNPLELRDRLGLASLHEISPAETSPAAAMSNAGQYLSTTIAKACATGVFFSKTSG